jgi:magnesium chelatase subunit H
VAAVIAQHRAANNGAFPETVTVNLWGLDAIKTRGESVAMVLHFVGARVVKEGTGRVARFELIPLDELTFDDPLTGEKNIPRPRVDVVCSMSGIFRDAFQNVVDLLDDLFQRAAGAEGEESERNYVKKHARELVDGGAGGGGGNGGIGGNATTTPNKIDPTTAARRIFSNPAGDYGSMVNERVGQGNWQAGEELGSTWASRNAFSYGRGGERGVARPEVLQSLLSRVDRVVQCVDSVEYGLTDIQEYYANTGGLLRAARDARAADLKKRAADGDQEAVAALKRAAEASSANGGVDPSSSLVACSVVESFAAEPLPRDLDAVLRAEYRTKLLNPKWAKAMVSQGSGGAYEVGQRFTAMVGWGGTAGFADKWAWDQAARTYALDESMAARLRKSNPQAFKNVLARCLEAAGRGLWDADAKELERLRELYAEMDDELEGVGGKGR